MTGLLLAWGNGDEAALEQLVPIVERELHRIARRCMAGGRHQAGFAERHPDLGHTIAGRAARDPDDGAAHGDITFA